MVSYRASRKAVTVVEIMIVIVISSVIMGVAMTMMSRNNVQFKKSNDLINIQRLMDIIVERIRSDVRSLKYVKSYSENKIEFVALKKDRYSDYEIKPIKEVLIKYEFDSERNTLYRSEESESSQDSSPKADFHGSKQILSMTFRPEFEDQDDDDSENKSCDDAKSKKFKSLNIAMQIAANEYSAKKPDGSTLSIACQFYSTCVESELKISKLRALNN